MKCKDCGSERIGLCVCISQGDPPHPGPRCHRCWMAFKRTQKERSHEQRVQRVYDLAPGEYDALYAFQGGRSWICQLATGKSRRLAVDHDHRTGQVRGLLCSICNHRILGHLERTDGVAAAERLVAYLKGTVTPFTILRKG